MVAFWAMPVEKAAWGSIVADGAAFSDYMFSHIDKEDGNRFSVVSGSIENPDVNKKIVNVLEGAMKAFNTRRCKYHGA